MDVRYKRGLMITLEDGTKIHVRKPALGIYQVSGTYGTDYGDKSFDLFYSKEYNSLKGVANYLKRNFDINLIID